MQILQFVVWRRLLFLGLGILLLVLLLIGVGPSAVWKHLGEIGSLYPLLLAIAGLRFLLQSLSQKVLAGGVRAPVGLFLKLPIGMAALDRTSPFLPLKGLTWGAKLLRKASGGRVGADPLIADRAIEEVVSGRGIEIFRSPAIRGRLEEGRLLLRSAWSRSPARFSISLGCQIVGLLCQVVEVYLAGRVVFPDFTVSHALLFSAAGLVVNSLFRFLPDGIGLLEGGFALLAVSLFGGGSTAGAVALGLVRKIRGFIWYLIGWAVVGSPVRLFRS